MQVVDSLFKIAYAASAYIEGFLDPLTNSSPITFVTAAVFILAVVTELSAGVGTVTEDPICTINTLEPLAKFEPNIIVLVSTSANLLQEH